MFIEFIELLNNNIELILRRLALYCFKAFEIFIFYFVQLISPECKYIIIVCYYICMYFSIYCNSYEAKRIQPL